MKVQILCVGKIKEKFYRDAIAEFEKRLSRYCKLEILEVAEHLKDVTRHCYTSKGRRESVGEHCWMMTLMAFFMMWYVG